MSEKRKKFMRAVSAGVLAFTLLILPLSGQNSVKADVSLKIGDLDGDGCVNVFDRMHLKRSILEGAPHFSVTNWRTTLDINKDGSIDPKDYTLLGQFLLKAGDKIIDTDETVSRFDGVDVSRWQDVIDWKTAALSGIDFVMIKAGEGTEIEQTFIRNITGAKEAGVQVGIYWFANATCPEEAVKEAEACLSFIKDYKLEYPVVYDFEYRTLGSEPNYSNPLAYDKAACTDTMIAFLDVIDANGYYPMVYTNKDFPQRFLEMDRLTAKYDIWYANYSSSLKEPDTECTMWQYSCTGRKNGIKTDVDLDVSFVDYKSLMVKNKLNGFN